VDHCGTCHACLDICPTKAFPRPYVLDARRCISYLTIEHKGHIAREFRPSSEIASLAATIVLPSVHGTSSRQPHAKPNCKRVKNFSAPKSPILLRLDDAAFRVLFAGSAVKRIGFDRFTRNVLIAAGNSGDPALASPVAKKLESSSALVRAMACGRSASSKRRSIWENSNGAFAPPRRTRWSKRMGGGNRRDCVATRPIEVKEGRPS